MTKQDRAIHLIDIENLAGTGRPSAKLVADCYSAYRPLIRDNDLVVVACNHGALLDVAGGWPTARHLIRSGENGADGALLDTLAFERVAARFRSVFIGSGDAIFADWAAWLGTQGISVTVVSRPKALSRRLRMASRYVVQLPSLEVHAHVAEPA